MPKVENLPSAQSEHSSDPALGLYLPATHSVQTPFGPVHPALHWQEVFMMLPAGEDDFDGQSEQVAGPKPVLYWLILHCEHAVPLSPVNPALHLQALIDMLAIGDVESGGHCEQKVTDDACTTPPTLTYWPAHNIKTGRFPHCVISPFQSSDTSTNAFRVEPREVPT